VNPMIKYGLVAVSAFIGWAVSKNIDGPIVHILVTALVAWVVWGMVNKMDSGGM